MRTYCLVIDDDHQEEYFETNIYKVLKKDHIELLPIFIRPKERKYMKKDHTGFDLELIKKDCIDAINSHNCTVVVSDYQIVTGSDVFTGLDLLDIIIGDHPYLYAVLYSGGKIKDAIKKLYKTLSDAIPSNQDRMSDQQMINVINQLKKISNINDLISGKGYAETVIKYMRCSPLALQQTFLFQLKEEYPNMKFKSCFPPFIGLCLNDIGNQIEKRTPLGCDFQQALIEQTMSYLIDVNED